MIATAEPDRTIMVIEDERIIRMLIVETLEDAGYQVVEAGDGPEGVALIETGGQLDMLVTDLGLPGGMNGREVAQVARLHHPDLKILFVTGYDDSAIGSGGGREAGMDLITKPFTVASLAARVTAMLEG